MKDRLVAAAVFVAIAAIGAGAVLVFQYGRHHPSPPSLEDAPIAAIPGQIAFVNEDHCVVVADASGASRTEVHCADAISWVSWVDANTVAFASYAPGRETVTELELTTGETRETEERSKFKAIVPESVNGEIAGVSYPNELYVSSEGKRRVIAEFDVPENWPPNFVTWSPDGEWLLLEYRGPKSSASELWIVSRDGSIKGTLAKDVIGWGPQTVSWWIDGAGYLPGLTGEPR